MLSKDVILFDWQLIKRDEPKKDGEEEIADEFSDGKNGKAIPMESNINNERHFDKNKKKPFLYNFMCAGLDVEKVSKMLIGHANLAVISDSKLHKMQTVVNSNMDNMEKKHEHNNLKNDSGL